MSIKNNVPRTTYACFRVHVHTERARHMYWVPGADVEVQLEGNEQIDKTRGTLRRPVRVWLETGEEN